MDNKAYIFDLIALAIIIWIFVFNKDLKRSKRLDDKYFKRLGFTVFLVIIVDLISVFLSKNVEHKYADAAVEVINDLIPIIYIVNALNWLKFVDAAVNNNERRIKEKYRYYYVPIAYMVILIGIYRVIAELDADYLSFLYAAVYIISSIGIPFFFMYKAYSMANKYQK